jgi:hypothetical protein
MDVASTIDVCRGLSAMDPSIVATGSIALVHPFRSLTGIGQATNEEERIFVVSSYS